MTPERFDEKVPASGSVTNVSGITKLSVDHEGLITDIWQLRQLTKEEKKHRVGFLPQELSM